MSNNSPHNFILCDSDFSWSYDDACHIYAITGESASAILDYSDLSIDLYERSDRLIPYNEFNLTNCTPTNTFDLTDCIQDIETTIVPTTITVSGNNLQHNFSICDEHLNPPIDQIPHNFDFYKIDKCGGVYSITINKGVYTYTGKDVVFGKVIEPISIDKGIYSYTGNDVTLSKIPLVQPDKGIYSYTGSDVGLYKNLLILRASKGIYTYTGNDVGLSKTKVIKPDKGIYSYTGSTVGFIYTLQSDKGIYSYTGNDVELSKFNSISIDKGIYTYTGSDVGLYKHNKLSIDKGIYDYTGHDVGLYKNLKIVRVPKTNYDYIGHDVGLYKHSVIQSDTGIYSYTGHNIGFIYTIPVDTGIYTYTGKDVTLSKTNVIQPDKGIYTYTGHNVGLVYKLSIDKGIYTYTGNDVNLRENLKIVRVPKTNYDYIGHDVGISFYPNALGYTGEYSVLDDLYVHHGEDLQPFEVYTGEYADSDSDGILIYHVFYPEIIISSQTAYDGFGGAGGLNFCESSCCYDSFDGGNLIFELSKYDANIRDPWGKCGPDNSTAINLSLQTNPRFEAFAYTGESGEAFIEKELTSFLPMGDDEYLLYNPPTQVKFHGDLDPLGQTGETCFAELTDERNGVIFEFLDGEAYQEVETEALMAYDEADWKYPFSKFEYEFDASFVFEGKEYIRFCPGYLIPAGNNVIFDFAGKITTGCYGWFATTGETLSNIDLAVIYGLGVRNYTGEYANASLTTYPYVPWLAKAYTGERADADLWIYPRLFGYTGESVTVEFERRKWECSTGEYANAYMIVPLPSIVWITEDECIENLYNPQTEDGDIDEDYENYDICIEDMPYRGRIEATCIDEYLWYPTIHPTVIGLNITGDNVILQTNARLQATALTGEYGYFQEYLISVGEYADCDFTTFVGVELDPITLTGEYVYGTLK